MKSIRNIAFSAFLTFAAFGAVTFTSCNKDECKDVNCNTGTCNESDGSCTCPTGFEGANCETLTRSKFVGTWTGTDKCSLRDYNVTLKISAASSEVEALIENPGGFGSNVTITGKVTDVNKLAFTNASVGNGRTLNGTMTFSGTTTFTGMEFTYTVTGGLDNDACTGTYSKQ